MDYETETEIERKARDRFEYFSDFMPETLDDIDNMDSFISLRKKGSDLALLEPSPENSQFNTAEALREYVYFNLYC